MIRYRFPAAERTRYGLAEVVEYDANAPLLSEVRALRKQVGITFAELSGRLKVGAWEDLGVLFWLVVLRNGSETVAWEDFDVDLDAVEMETDDEEKAAAPSDGASNG